METKLAGEGSNCRLQLEGMLPLSVPSRCGVRRGVSPEKKLGSAFLLWPKPNVGLSDSEADPDDDANGVIGLNVLACVWRGDHGHAHVGASTPRPPSHALSKVALMRRQQQA